MPAPSPPLRFEMSESYSTIYGFPQRVPPTDYHLELRSPMPAQLSYILGADWRSRCIETTSNNRFVKEWRYIPLSDDDDDDDETEHCLRMRRCGAQLVQMKFWLQEQQGRYNEEASKQIMGWPSDGGVWVYQLPVNPFAGKPIEETIDEQFAALARYSSGLREDPREKVWNLKSELAKTSDMDQFCEVLSKYGAKHYENLFSCPETTRLRLWNSSQSKGFLSTILRSG